MASDGMDHRTLPPTRRKVSNGMPMTISVVYLNKYEVCGLPKILHFVPGPPVNE